MADAFREEQEFYQSLVERGVVSIDESALLRRVLPLALVRKLLGEKPTRAQGHVPHVDIASPDGTVWRLTINNDGKAKTERLEN